MLLKDLKVIVKAQVCFALHFYICDMVDCSLGSVCSFFSHWVSSSEVTSVNNLSQSHGLSSYKTMTFVKINLNIQLKVKQIFYCLLKLK